MSPLTKQRLASFPNADAIAHSPLRSGAVPRQWSPLAPFCARRAAFFWRRSEFCVWRCLDWIFLRRESDILGMGVILGLVTDQRWTATIETASRKRFLVWQRQNIVGLKSVKPRLPSRNE